MIRKLKRNQWILGYPVSFIFFFSVPSLLWAKPKLVCPEGYDRSITDPEPVEIEKLLQKVLELRLESGPKAIQSNEVFASKIRETFDMKQVKTKMEQFYRLLFYIQSGIPRESGAEISLNPQDVRDILLTSRVFRDPTVPNQISRVVIHRQNQEQPKYVVGFLDEKTFLPLNDGKGFYTMDKGRCQHTKSLMFEAEFSFTLRMLKNGNLVAQNFKGVDLYGDFGSEGLFAVDLEYVSLHSVEFFKGTKDGKIRAYVSREEFRQNKHNPLLKIITRFVGDTSVQPIDW